MKLVLSGGHITPALALMQQIKAKGDQAIVLGKAGKQGPSVEAMETQKLGFPFYPIPEWKFHRYSLFKSILQMPQGIMAIVRSYRYIKQAKSDACVVFGGYISLPVAIAARCHRLPVFLHEQTMNPGLGSRLVSRFTTHIFTAFPQAKFNRPYTLVGNLIRAEFYQSNPTPSWIPSDLADLPLLYITGGHQGSKLINEVMSTLYPHLAKTHVIVHQCGGTGIQDYQTSLEQIRLKLPPDLQARVIIKPWFPAGEAAWLMQYAAVVIGRAGANTVSEILVCRTPAVLIPLLSDPSSEQYLQANYVADQGLGQVIREEHFTPDTVITALSTLSTVSRRDRSPSSPPPESSVDQVYSHLQAVVAHA
jgi:UDP-N-acetylglucosamine--N-acetylmuramyl-(pentapeptide) pyrophosphoryl-undecaprenol N-acetylglucosamine transferase